MNEWQSVLEVGAAYRAGSITREDYWAEMRLWHRRLSDYSRLVECDLIDRIEIAAEGTQVVLANGLRFAWNPDDVRAVPNVLINHGDYESEERRIFLEMAERFPVVFDIGANVGWYSLHAASVVRGSGGRVYAFEPVPSTFEMLQRNVALNRASDVLTTFNLGAGVKDEVVTFHLPSIAGSVGASRRALFPDDDNVATTCHLTSLDTFVAANKLPDVSLMKLDVEGAEIFALKGAIETIERCRPVIMLEMLRKWSAVYDYHPNDILDLVGSIGYECWAPDGSKWRSVARIDEEEEETNFFLLHRPTHDGLLSA